ncbi:DNA polymerase alpha catalytic subunit [Bienertia sinuspersici]
MTFELLKNLVERRRMVKSWLKKASGIKVQQFNIQQQALKLTANSLYGCLGSLNFRFYAKPLAELITLRGREILQNTVDLVQDMLNLEVSPLVLKGGMLYVASGVFHFFQVNKKYRCVEIELDGFTRGCCSSRRKKYAAVKLQFQDGKTYEVIEQKGLDMVRRDWSLLSKEVGDYCFSQILSGGSCEDVVESIHSSHMKVQEEMRKGEVPLEKYIIIKSLTKDPEDYLDAKNQPRVQVILWTSLETTPETSSGIAQRARHPDELKNNSSTWMIDINYYLSQQIHPVVSRLCAFVKGTDPARLADCLELDFSKFQRKFNHLTSNDPSSSLLCSVDDEDRFQGCEPLRLSCPSCSGTFDCPSIFSTLIAPRPFHNISSTNQNGLLTFLGQKASRWVHLNILQGCNDGVDLYKQLTYFCFIFDTVRCIDKVDPSVKLRIEELNRVRPMVKSAANVAQKLLDRCAYGWVQLYDFFVTP